VLAASALLAAGGCGGREANGAQTQGGAPGQGAAPGAPAALPAAGAAGRRVPVEVRLIEPRPVTYSIQTVGSLQAREVLRVPARVSGVVEDVKFQEGQSVGPGTVLARIDPERYALAAQRAEATHAQALAEAREAEAALEKRKALRERDPGWVTEEELTNFTAQLDRARAAAAAAAAARDLALKERRDSDVRVEYAGIIDRKSVDTGQYVNAGDSLATLVDTRRLKLSFKVAESESARLAVGSRITFKVKALPGREFEGSLYHVGEVADPASRMVECLAWVDNRGRTLRPGYFAEVAAEIEEKRASIVVPQTAVLPTERGFVAFVVGAGDTAEERRVRLGLYTRDGGVEVLEGLEAGEPLVVRGASLLKNGMPVSAQTP
jgi:multidrug efflux system membrane fusion protein